MSRILLILLLGVQPLAGQNAEDLRAVYSVMFEVAADSLEVPNVCVVPSSAYFVSDGVGDPAVRLERPSGEHRRVLRSVAEDQLGDRLTSYCLTRPRSGFETALERARRLVDDPLFGAAYFFFDPYGARAVQFRVSAPLFDAPGAARISARVLTHSRRLTRWACYVQRSPRGTWYAHDCRISGEIA